MSGEENARPGLLAGSQRWVAPCAPGSSFLCSPQVTVELTPAGTGTPGRWSWSRASPLPDLLGRAEGQSPRPGLCPAPGHVQVSHRLSTCTHTSDLPPAVWVSEEELRVPRQSGGGGRGPPAQIHSKSTCLLRFPGKITITPTRCGPRTVSPSIAGGSAHLREGLGPGAPPHLTSMRLFPQGQLSLPPGECHSASLSLLRAEYEEQLRCCLLFIFQERGLFQQV